MIDILYSIVVDSLGGILVIPDVDKVFDELRPKRETWGASPGAAQRQRAAMMRSEALN